MLLWRVMEKGILNPSLGRLFYYSGHGVFSMPLSHLCNYMFDSISDLLAHCSLRTESVQKWLEANVDIDATKGERSHDECAACTRRWIHLDPSCG